MDNSTQTAFSLEWLLCVTDTRVEAFFSTTILISSYQRPISISLPYPHNFPLLTASFFTHITHPIPHYRFNSNPMPSVAFIWCTLV